MIEVIPAFMGGLVGSAHCIGMCGGFAITIGATKKRFGPALARQLLYSAGRVFTYAFLGACAGAAGRVLIGSGGAVALIQRGLSMLAGCVMILVGAAMLGLFRKWGRVGALVALLTPTWRRCMSAPGGFGAFVAGVATGFLPCGLLYTFVVLAVGSGDAIDGAALMIAFGLGTMPAMIAVGCGGTFVSAVARARLMRVAACLLIAFGGVTVHRGYALDVETCCAADAPA